MDRIRFSQVIFATVLAVLSPAVWADSEVIGIISLVGDEVSVVTRAMDTGSSVSKANKEGLSSHSEGLDHLALLTAASAIEKKDPAAVTVMLGLKDRSLYENQLAPLLNGDTAAVPAGLRAVIADENMTKVLVFTKYRGPAFFHSDIGGVGAGYVHGLGYYMDHSQINTNLNSHGQSGFLAPYVYLTATLLDAHTFKVIRQSIEMQSDVLWVAGSKGDLPWDVLDANEKLAAIRALTKKAVEEGVGQVL